MKKEKYIRQGIESAKILIKNRNYSKAIELIVELLETEPNQKMCIKLLFEVKRKWNKEKKRIVKESLRRIEPLWKQKKYNDLLRIYRSLNEFYPDYRKTEKGLEKLKTIFNKRRQIEEKKFLQKGWTKISELWKEKNYKDTIKACNEYLEIDPSDVRVIKIDSKARKKYIDKKLEMGKNLLERKDYRNLLNLYEKLLRIFPEYSKLHKLIFKCKIFMAKEAEKRKNAHVNLEIGKINQMYKKGYYNDAIQKYQELMQINPQNRQIKKIFEKIAKAEKKIIEKTLIDQMINASRQMKKDYLVNKEKYIKI